MDLTFFPFYCTIYLLIIKAMMRTSSIHVLHRKLPVDERRVLYSDANTSLSVYRSRVWRCVGYNGRARYSLYQVRVNPFLLCFIAWIFDFFATDHKADFVSETRWYHVFCVLGIYPEGFFIPFVTNRVRL